MHSATIAVFSILLAVLCFEAHALRPFPKRKNHPEQNHAHRPAQHPANHRGHRRGQLPANRREHRPGQLPENHRVNTKL
ncbi:hypothetical protein D918_02594 [Trichuris suis]|uniref:Secreted protein n=1 Tax=Trichuris suis TaxID=68888 RepID=A0A085M8U1_9BILA|nr:hypothetical protein M513_05553 [Trichuris suis]KHJ47048.1 hypothetical protein D918_02594 [Trichuris suis]